MKKTSKRPPKGWVKHPKTLQDVVQSLEAAGATVDYHGKGRIDPKSVILDPEPERSFTMTEFSKINFARAMQWHSMGIGEWSISDWAVAMVGEAGEACNMIKKYNRVRDSLHSNNAQPYDKAKLADELADTFVYLDLLATRCGFSLQEIVRHKFNAISLREGLPHRI